MPYNPGGLSDAEGDRLTAASRWLVKYIATGSEWRRSLWDSAPKPSPLVQGKKIAPTLGADLAAVQLISADDHLQAIAVLSGGILLSDDRKSADRVIVNYAFYTLMRGSLEASAWASWLLDGTIAQDERLARYYSLRLKNLHEQTKDDSRKADAKALIDTLGPEAQKLGIPPKYSKPKDGSPGDLIGFGPKGLPKVTKVLSDLLPLEHPESKMKLGAHIYDRLSARAHAMPFGLLQGAKYAPSSNPGEKLALLQFEMAPTMELMHDVVGLHDQANARYTVYAGIDVSEWIKARGPIPAL